jgi:hypothetical protein
MQKGSPMWQPHSCPHRSRRSGSIPGLPYPPLRPSQFKAEAMGISSNRKRQKGAIYYSVTLLREAARWVILIVANHSPRLYTRRVIGEETLSSTSAFSLRHSDAWSATTSSFILRQYRKLTGH